MPRTEPPCVVTYKLPGPETLAVEPHLATLAILDTTLHASIHALIAAHPEMGSSELLLEEAPCSPASWLAWALVVDLRAAEATLNHYRLALDHDAGIATSQPECEF